MIKLLIVDDEKFIAEGIKELIEKNIEDVKVYCFYDPYQAVLCAKENQIDLLLTDINMPEIDGLELQKRIVDLYENVKTIFLSGYNDFEYVKKAIRQNSTDYVLKTEDDQVLIDSINKAISLINKQKSDNQFLALSKNYIENTRPFLKQRFFNMCFTQNKSFDDFMFRMINLNIDMSKKMIVVACKMTSNEKIEEWSENKVTSIALFQDKLKQRLNIEEYIMGDDVVIWFLQSKNDDMEFLAALSYLSGMLDIVSNIIKKQIGLNVLYVIKNEYCSACQISSVVGELKQILFRIKVKDNFGVMTSDYADKFLESFKANTYELLRELNINMNDITKYIDKSDKKNALKSVLIYFETLSKIDDFALLQENYTKLKLNIMKEINRNGVPDFVSDDINKIELINSFFDSNGKIESSQYMKIVSIIIESRKTIEISQCQKVVNSINLYINENLNGDLSMAAISDVAHFNASYLSRMYKKETGMLISEFIQLKKIEKAKDLLVSTNQKICQIGIDIGIDNPANFTRYFKNYTGLTPVEYRNRHLRVIK